MNEDDRVRRLALVQGAYFAATGVWPLVDMKSFEKVTGPKADKWLVRTVGVLVAAIGGALVAAGARRAVTRELAALAVGSACGLGAIDVVYSTAGRISRIYLADAAAEAALVGAWAASFAASRAPSGSGAR
jgi:hypothetical protein